MLKSNRTQRGTRLGIVRDFHFAQIPDRLIRNHRITRTARCLYGVYHSHSEKKDFRKEIPETNPYQRTIANELGSSIETVRIRTRELQIYGWVTVKNRGWQANLITLHSKPKR